MATPSTGAYPAFPTLDHDDRILRLLREKSPEGVRELLLEWGPRVKGALLVKFGGKMESQIDAAVNEAAYRLWQCVDGLDASRQALGPYFFVTARNALIDQLRAEAVDQHVVPPEELEHHVPRGDGHPPSSELLVDVMACVQQLSELQRRVVIADLRGGRPVPADDLAAELGIKPQAVYEARSRAHRRLRELLLERGHPFP